MKKQPNPIDAQVGANIRNLRAAKGITQEALAGHLSITFQQVQKYEKGTNRVSASRMHDIAAVFGVPVSDLFTGTTDTGNSAGVPLMSKEAYSVAAAFDKIADTKQRAAVRNLVRVMAGQSGAEIAIEVEAEFAAGKMSIDEARAAVGLEPLPSPRH